jgi:hypothetical protein
MQTKIKQADWTEALDNERKSCNEDLCKQKGSKGVLFYNL